MTLIELAQKLRPLIEKAAQSLSDEDALEAIQLYPAWTAPHDYVADERVQDEGLLYRCIQPHTSQDDWKPGVTPALWTRVAPPGVIPVWVQPTGAQDAYMKGDKVHYLTADDPVYTSLIDNNVWSPEAYPSAWQMD